MKLFGMDKSIFAPLNNKSILLFQKSHLMLNQFRYLVRFFIATKYYHFFNSIEFQYFVYLALSKKSIHINNQHNDKKNALNCFCNSISSMQHR